MNKPKPEFSIIIVLIAILWVVTILFTVNQSKRSTYKALDAQTQECIELRKVVEKTHAFAMTQPNNVRIIFRNLGYSVTMSPVPVTEDTTSEKAK